MKKFFCLTLVCKLSALSEFELHNIDKVHKLGYSGDTIIIGVTDDAFNQNHISLKDKIVKSTYPTDINGKQLVPNLQKSTHGSHVAGIAVGAKIDNNKPYGVAYRAKFYGAGVFPEGSYTQTPNIYDFFKDVSIINNSWGISYYPHLDLRASASGLVSCAQTLNGQNVNICQIPLTYIKQADSVANDLYKLSLDEKLLNVFAAGNEGILTPALHATLPSYDESLRAWLAVGALDANEITLEADGTLVVASKGLADFSNGFKGATNFSLVAAGVDINNVDSSTNNGFTKKSGTSMAAPIVSGTAALVKQKFPFLDGKQIADVLLSTANKNYKAPKFTVKQVTDGTNQPKFLIVYISQDPPTVENEIKRDLKQLYNGMQVQINGQWVDYSDYIWNNRDGVQSQKLNTSTVNFINGVVRVEKEELFGQGILDAQKALKGLSVLDANRLSDQDILKYEKEPDTAYYTINTAGHNAEFSNDISQRKWDESTHLSNAANKPMHLTDLNIGLAKEGEGVLIISGKNTYEGATLVKQGELKLKGKLTNNAYVEKKAILSGNGIVGQNLNNKGIVRPGNEDLSDLTVQGTYTQEGIDSKLQLDFGNYNNSKLIAKNYDIKGGNLEYIPLPKYYTLYNSVKINLGDLGKSLSSFDNVLVQNTYALNFNFVLSNDLVSINEALIKPNLKPNAYEIPNTSLGNALRQLRSRTDLSQAYQEFFASLDNGIDVKTKLDRVEGSAYLSAFNNYDQLNLMQNNILFTLNPLNINNFAQNNISLASTYLPRIFSDEEYFWYLTPNYKYYKDKDFSGQKTGINISLGENFSSGFLAYALSLSSAKFNFNDGSDLKGYNVDLLLNYNHDLDFIKILSGLGIGMGFNTIDRFVVEPIEGKYKTLQASAQLGATKDIILGEDFVLNPLMYFTHSFFYQEDFKENKSPFAKDYESLKHYSMNASLGFNLAKNIEQDDYQASFSAFAIFEKRIYGKTLESKASFVDFPIGFIQKYKLKDNTLSQGFNLEFLYKNNMFWQFMLMNRFSHNAYELHLMNSIGKRF
ncbi:TPA: S8 family serine peptidase [Campylobacter jejuni]|nr:S8 family serine peptidase [Campylobacter jejuni]HDZ5084413.1 S8 family serine peptidase [Campylobacter jejuni]HDZ5087546.1 S8 family serine peptidase [Campylobacter jejuni]HDZ5090761.1 S8 family serine peptidase [Campylobacter jejuni]HDZ5092575.1 S8 family serine peptidase [Campylobacter jejuni]